ncbi:AAA family ATPase [[Clostridium] innocuum]|nr:AAA family ATPase [[Clostridium] innocuum]MCR0559644.1 AAA family ATPase [[Clostridium] innocuum]MCR0602662.1 AAA family ATPase [[Clostridium] innocuum]
MGYQLQKVFIYEFEVKKIYKRESDGNTLIEARTIKIDDDYKGMKFKSMKLSGYFPVIYQGDIYKANVKICESKSFGYYIKIIDDLVFVLPHTKKAIIDFIKSRTKSLKANEIRELVDYGGKKTISIIVNHPEQVSENTSLTPIRVKNLKNKLDFDVYYEKLMMFLQTLNIGAEIALSIYDNFGHDSITRIKDNPYKLRAVTEISFQETDAIACKLGFAHNDRKRVKSAILEYTDSKTKNEGDVCIEKRDLLDNLNSFLQYISSYSQEFTVKEIEDSLLELESKQKLVKERYNECDYFYRNNAYICEKEISELVRSMVSHKVQAVDFERKERYLLSLSNLASKQRAGIDMALSNRISILTGGPGTGKTYTVNQVIKAYKKFGKTKIILMAPTGRASSKLSEVSGYPATTIHRALGIKPNEKADVYVKSQKILEADLIIVDETSMVDIYLFSALLRSISPDSCLLLVGDSNQLPSVGPGLILRDLIDTGKVPVTELNEIFRQSMDSQIVLNSHKIQQGLTTKDAGGLTFDPQKGDFYFIERDEIEDLAMSIVRMAGRCHRIKHYPIEEILVLSPIKLDILGTHNLNRELQDIFNPKSKSTKLYIKDSLTEFRMGDKVINLMNDADANIFNGEIGFIIDIYEDEMSVKIKVDFFNNKVIVFDEEMIDNLELAYAITAHKSQGTESDVVIMPISPIHKYMLNMNLIYTSWTRAKKMVICIGDKETLDEVIKSHNVVMRNSLLKERVKGQL